MYYFEFGGLKLQVHDDRCKALTLAREHGGSMRTVVTEVRLPILDPRLCGQVPVIDAGKVTVGHQVPPHGTQILSQVFFAFFGE